MAHLGDFALETTVYAKFCTVTTTGAPTQLAGSPVVSVYENDDNTQITAGVTLNVDEDGVTGLNQLVIAATAANGYEAGKFYDAVITTGTVGGTSVVGYVVASFTMQATSALRPTTAGRTLDVTAANKVNGVVLVDTLTTYTGDTPQTGDSFARIGATGSGLTTLASQASVNTIDDFLDTEIAALLAAVDTEVAAILALLDDPRGEPGQTAPPVNPDAVTKIDYLYKALRNKQTQTATTWSLFADDAATVDQKSTVADDGVTFTRGEIASGP